MRIDFSEVNSSDPEYQKVFKMAEDRWFVLERKYVAAVKSGDLTDEERSAMEFDIVMTSKFLQAMVDVMNYEVEAFENRVEDNAVVMAA